MLRGRNLAPALRLLGPGGAFDLFELLLLGLEPPLQLLFHLLSLRLGLLQLPRQSLHLALLTFQRLSEELVRLVLFLMHLLQVFGDLVHRVVVPDLRLLG